MPINLNIPWHQGCLTISHADWLYLQQNAKFSLLLHWGKDSPSLLLLMPQLSPDALSWQKGWSEPAGECPSWVSISLSPSQCLGVEGCRQHYIVLLQALHLPQHVWKFLIIVNNLLISYYKGRREGVLGKPCSSWSWMGWKGLPIEESVRQLGPWSVLCLGRWGGTALSNSVEMVKWGLLSISLSELYAFIF